MTSQTHQATTSTLQASHQAQVDPSTARLPSTCHFNEVPGLGRLRAMVKGALTQQWPTRRLPLCPPAHGAIVSGDMLRAPHLLQRADESALVLFLPDDFAPHVGTLAAKVPQVRVHELVSLRKRETYLSLSVPSSQGQATRPALPLTIWVRVQDIMDEYLERSLTGDPQGLPVVLVAGIQVALGRWVFDKAQTARVDAALGGCEDSPFKRHDDEKQRALDKAEKYGERPWLFMRYELTNLSRRFAVNWAPVCTMRDGRMVDYSLD